MDVLSEEDRQLPQIQHVLPMLRRGIGVHHSGAGAAPAAAATRHRVTGNHSWMTLWALWPSPLCRAMPCRAVLCSGPLLSSPLLR